ncbi:MAG: hexosyltransferase [Gemmatimonadetes bacterium]|nr:MAG: hexosyltransferase [Gemmatimonadota bacterium]PYP31068.1 MAG: hexosyltransferase [Gemmatimonadota bacterium]
MKLGLVVPGGVARTSEDGRIPCLHWLIERLARRHEVHVYSLRGAPRPDRYSFLGATVHHAGVRPLSLRTLAAIVAEHGRRPFDLLHAFWVTPPGVIAAWAGTMIRRPVLLHVGGNEVVALPEIRYGGLSTRRGRFWVRVGLAGATRITAASQPMLDVIRARGHTAERVPLGVALERWCVAAPRPRRAGATARLVHVADLNLVKDQTTLLEAARRLAERGVVFQLDIAGRDTLGGAVANLARQCGVGDHVRFHGHLPHERLHALVTEADLLWLSSRHEAGPLVVLEAAVVGVPTVGTAVGHVAEWAPEAAVAVPVCDPEALARETVRLLGDEARRLSLAREAQRRALACDADWTACRFESLYDKIVNGARPNGRDR